jgi:anti-sigma regulatory factor (Ser/Thr protein kinase)
VVIDGWRGPGWRVVDANPRHSAEIRHWVTAFVIRRGCPVDTDDAALVVTELFANAVMHGPASGRVLVGFCLWRGGVRIVVCDGGGLDEPRLGQAGEQAEGLRGLQIVDALAVRWGHFRVGTARIVWCDLGGPMRVPGSDALAWLRRVLSVGFPGRACPSAGQRVSA